VVEPRDTVVVVEPAFSEFAAAADVARARVVAFRTDDDDFVVDAARLGAVVRRERPKLVYLGTPGNPSGRVVPRSTILEVAAAAESVSARLVLDESFLSLSSGFSALEVSLPPSVVRLRSSTKDHALAGIRVGYALLPPSLAARMERARPPWSTSAPAQAALLAALDARSFLIESRGALLADRRRQDEQLRSLGFRVVPSETIYALVDVGNGAAFRRRLLARHGVLVRDCSSFGLPNYIRVCARPKPDDARIVAAFARESRES
jgi:histidinol-phosphate/aromatic aminotransferase/cobyric acid decarboxylase-like protein